jgi:iron complex outermembrane receptor protein
VGGLPCVLSIPVKQDLEEWGGKISLGWKYNAHGLAYLSYSRGFKSGAFDTRALAAFAGNADKPVGPEFLDAYEFGWKNTLYDGAMEINAAIFHYVWKDLQTFATDTGGAPAFLNVPETRLTGGELMTRWSLDTGWYFQAGVGYTDSEIVDSGGLTSAKKGAPATKTPELTVTGLIRKIHRFESSVLALQSNFTYADETNSSSSGDPLERIAATFFVNARASLKFGREQQYELALWGENLTGEKTCINIGREGSLTNSVTCLPNAGMAFYGASFEVRF